MNSRLLRWFLGDRYAYETLAMEDIDLQGDRIFRQHRMPIHEARNEAENESGVVRKPFRVVNGRLAHR